MPLSTLFLWLTLLVFQFNFLLARSGVSIITFPSPFPAGTARTGEVVKLLADDVLLISSSRANGNEGSVGLSTRNADGTWTLPTMYGTPFAAHAGDNDYFGFALDVTSDLLAVGAYQEESQSVLVDSIPDNAGSANGAAYAFNLVRSPTAPPTLEATPTYFKSDSTNSNGDQLGGTVAVYGNILAVGSARSDFCETGLGPNDQPYTTGCTRSGAVLVYHRRATDSVWEFVIRIHAPAASFGGNRFFGSRLTLSSRHMFVSMERDPYCDVALTDSSCSQNGGVYIYPYTATGGDGSEPHHWSYQQVLKPAVNTGTTIQFGNALTIGEGLATDGLGGDLLAVGVIRDDNCQVGPDTFPVALNACAQSGSVYLFEETAGVFGVGKYFKPQKSFANVAGFGSGISFSASPTTLYMVVGQYSDESCETGVGANAFNFGCGAGNTESGAVQIFEMPYASSVWALGSFVKPPVLGIDQWFGASVSISHVGSPHVLIGSSRINGFDGAAYLYENLLFTVTPTETPTLDGVDLWAGPGLFLWSTCPLVVSVDVAYSAGFIVGNPTGVVVNVTVLGREGPPPSLEMATDSPPTTFTACFGGPISSEVSVFQCVLYSHLQALTTAWPDVAEVLTFRVSGPHSGSLESIIVDFIDDVVTNHQRDCAAFQRLL